MSNDYLMESSCEVDRLEKKTDAAFSFDNLVRAGLRAGMVALDVGCGSGAVTRTIAEITGCDAFGVDRSEDRIDAATKLARELVAPVRFLASEGHQMPWREPIFDFTWSRFLFEYLSEPKDVLSEMIRVTKPGGIVAVADLDAQMTQFFPKPDHLKNILDHGLQLLAKQGFDPDIGRKLFSMFRELRLGRVRSVAIPYQTYCGGLPEPALENWAQKLATSSTLLKRLDPSVDWDQFSDGLMAHLRSPDVFYYSTLILTTGVKM